MDLKTVSILIAITGGSLGILVALVKAVAWLVGSLNKKISRSECHTAMDSISEKIDNVENTVTRVDKENAVQGETLKAINVTLGKFEKCQGKIWKKINGD